VAGSVKEKVIEAIKSAKGGYHQLVLVVGKSGTGKSKMLHEVAKELGSKVINVNLELSSELLQLSARQRVLNLRSLLDNTIVGLEDPIFLDNIEILFAPELKQDPLRLLQSLSRNHSIVVTWNGEVKEKQLYYAETGHREYRRYATSDLFCVCV